MSKVVNEVQEIAFHHNGVGGRGFYAVRFTSDIAAVSEEESAIWNLTMGEPIKDAKFYAVVTDTPGECYVVCIDLLPTRGVKFGGNSWRGDTYESELREAIKKAISEGSTSGGIRIGPFTI